MTAKVETSHADGRRVSISGMLKRLGVSRSGYRAFLCHKSSAGEQRKNMVKDKIRKIYDDSRQNYGVLKITRELQKDGERISERTVGKYMREMGLKAQWIRPWTTTTRDSDFSSELHNILDEQFNRNAQTRSGVPISHTYGSWMVYLSDEHHGSFFKEDHRLDALRFYGGVRD